MLLKELIFSTNTTIFKITLNFISKVILHFILHFNTFALADLFYPIIRPPHKGIRKGWKCDNGNGWQGV